MTDEPETDTAGRAKLDSKLVSSLARAGFQARRRHDPATKGENAEAARAAWTEARANEVRVARATLRLLQARGLDVVQTGSGDA
ncbi:hypothetical protein [Jannaschia pohangensis]|uniref:Uncharacterized protein n=1 Tax=Jannaschia pohangensis TaxID=390807 RepID=A0A1I3M6B7_9RHOB|nr:hypothetical protein [Jannaschia pohangensis]SFI92226.1 hypothetical protein SAMN04488095_1738 [Jannaschia pohangensis]